jgi:hypothetical protein
MKIIITRKQQCSATLTIKPKDDKVKGNFLI